MDTSIISKKVDSYKEVPESKAGLKDVYIIKSSGDKYVLSMDAGSSWNWLSEEYIEPVVTKWLNKNQADISPDVVEYDIDEKIMRVIEQLETEYNLQRQYTNEGHGTCIHCSCSEESIGNDLTFVTYLTEE